MIHRGNADLAQSHRLRQRRSYTGIGRTRIPKRFCRRDVRRRTRWGCRVVRCCDLNVGYDPIESAVALDGKGLKMERRGHLSDRINGDRVGGATGLAGLNHEGADGESFFGSSVGFQRRWIRSDNFLATYHEGSPSKLGDEFVLVSDEKREFLVKHGFSPMRTLP